MIEFDIDWYGTYARKSAVCDYLEILAIHGYTVSEERLADLIRDNGWISYLAARIQDSEPEDRGPEPDDDDTQITEAQDEASVRVDDVGSILRERRDLLGKLYPFTLDAGGSLVSFTGGLSDDSSYLALLALTVAHAAGVSGLPRKPAYVFEDVLEAALNASSLRTACLGGISRGSGDFTETLRGGCARVGLAVDPSRAPYRVFANEEGSDTISNMWPEDTRMGGVQFVGQATCAKSNSWKAKMMEPPIGHWQDWLQRKLPPVSFLSVPHHVEANTRSYLISVDASRDVMDRLRLARVERALLPDEATTVSVVLHAPVDPW